MPQEKRFFCAPLGLKLPLVYHNWPRTIVRSRASNGCVGLPEKGREKEDKKGEDRY
jgi:hypothetical protein